MSLRLKTGIHMRKITRGQVCPSYFEVLKLFGFKAQTFIVSHIIHRKKLKNPQRVFPVM